MKLALSLVINLLLIIPISAQTLNADERRITAYIDANSASAVDLLERVINIGSPTEDIDGVKGVGAVLRKELEAIGFETRWIDMPAEAKRAGHLVAEMKGTKGKRILVLGHLDTVLRGERFRREGNRGFGTGIGDMHCGNVIAVEAL